MDNVSKITDSGICIGCGACGGCEHITFETNAKGFPAPVIDSLCEHCGKCLGLCEMESHTDDEEDT